MMDLESQHPVVEELLTNKYFGDTLLVCANGHLTDNKLAVGLLFPCLLSSDIFALPIENVLLVPDYTMEEIGREFEKLIIGGNCKIPTNNSNNSSSGVVVNSSIHNERVEHDNSPAELVIDDTIENGFDENCDNIEIGQTNEETIEIFVNNNGASTPPDDATIIETDDIPPDIQVELFSGNDDHDNDNTEKDDNDTDGNLFSIFRSKDKNTTSFSELSKNNSLKQSTSTSSSSSSILKKPVLKQTRLKLQLEDDCANVIENLPGMPDPDNIKKEPSPKKSPGKQSPRREVSVVEYRKPGRPRTKPETKTKLSNTGQTRFKMKSAEWVANEDFKCKVCGKVLSCRGSFDRHTRMHTNDKPYQCSFCPKRFTEACKKSVHERIHSGAKPYPCQHCSKSFRTATQRQIHQRSHTKDKPYKCSECDKEFAQPYSVKVHMEKFHPK